MTPRTITAILAAVLMPASAQAAAWATACEEALCLFRHEVAAPGGAGTSALFEILVDADAATASIVLTTPLGVALEPGVRIEADRREWTAPIRVCHADGCRATVDLDEDDLAHILKQSAIEIEYHAFGAAEPASLHLPLTGLVSAMTSQGR